MGFVTFLSEAPSFEDANVNNRSNEKSLSAFMVMECCCKVISGNDGYKKTANGDQFIHPKHLYIDTS